MPGEKDFAIGSDISARYGAGAEAADVIAEALSAERERCAKIAQQTAEHYGEAAVGSAIKNAVRNAHTKIRKE